MIVSPAVAELLSRGVAEVIDREHLTARLARGDKLRIKFGTDPTSPHLHLGRAVVLLKLRDLQKLGHTIVFIVGDFTGVIGDTSDKESERPMLTPEAVHVNMQTYLLQAGKILDIEHVEVHYNSEWLGKLTYKEIGEQADRFSVAEFIARENIRTRLDAGKRVSLREMLYPLMQGYDSVAVKADVELGGTDQRFNILAGRRLQEQYGQPPQDIILTNLILGTDGRKMSSSWGNTINLTDTPSDMFGKVMSIPDTLIVPYLIHCTRMPLDEVTSLEHTILQGANPRDAKMRLAREVVTLWHSSVHAHEAEEHFVTVFQKKERPDFIETKTIQQGTHSVIDLLCATGLATSKTEARKLVIQKGVSIDDIIIDDPELSITIPPNGIVVQKGKRTFIRVTTQSPA